MMAAICRLPAAATLETFSDCLSTKPVERLAVSKVLSYTESRSRVVR